MIRTSYLGTEYLLRGEAVFDMLLKTDWKCVIHGVIFLNKQLDIINAGSRKDGDVFYRLSDKAAAPPAFL